MPSNSDVEPGLTNRSRDGWIAIVPARGGSMGTPSDDSSSESALLRVLDHLPDPGGFEPELVVFLQATSPLLMKLLLAARGQPSQQRPDASSIVRDVRLLAVDFDGVMTDNRVYISEDGREAVACNRGDGWGIARLRDAGVEVVIISTEVNPVVRARARKLAVDCVHGCDDKLSALRRIVDDRGLDASQVAYVGNDANDLSCLRWAGVPIAVADAEPVALEAARLVTTRPGGRGAIREVAEWILAARATEETRRMSNEGNAPRGGGQ